MNQNSDDDFETKGRLFNFLNSWAHMELVSGHPVPDENLPFSRGSLIRIKKSPRPDKIPDDAIAMFVDYNWSTYKVIGTKVMMPVTTEETQSIQTEEVEKIQYRMRVIFDERVVELWNTKPEELGENYVKIPIDD